MAHSIVYVASLLLLFFSSFDTFGAKTMAYEIPRTQQSQSVTEARNDFAFSMYRELLKENGNEKNLFYSPYSVSSAMSMLLLGARGKSAAELRKGLEFGNWDGIHEQNREIRQKIGKIVEGVVLKTANRLFPEEKFKILQKYLSECEEFYGSEVQPLDFVGNAEAARKKVNDWVLEQTNDKIKDLMPPGSVTPDTVLVLANAIYFKGKWAKEFDSRMTKKVDFHISEAKTSKVDMMAMKTKLNIGISEELNAKVVHVPYEGDSTSMIIVLPDKEYGLAAVERALTAQKLLKMEMFKEDVKLQLPKFKLEFGSSLIKSFEALGVRSIFDSGADLSGISGSRGLAVSAIEHKAFVEVNEKGTEAAAATGISISRMALPIVHQFNCDHPFLFFIWHKPTNLILFSGRYVNPDT